MPIRPRSGSRQVERQRKSCCSSSVLGCLKLKTSQGDFQVPLQVHVYDFALPVDTHLKSAKPRKGV